MGFEAWRQMTPYLIFNTCVFLQGAILFGIDTGSFGSLQALPSFLRRFGVFDAAEQEYLLPPTRKALMNSLPWIGKITGCFGAEVFIEKLGYKRTMYAVGVIQIVGVVVEMTSHAWAQFTVGRIIAYFAVGLVENAVPCYNAETAPPAVRGLLAGSIMFVTALGNLWGAGMSRAYSTTLTKEGWLVPVAMQFIPAIGILALVPFTPESPRWLVLKGQNQNAKANLDKIRHRSEVESGATAAEIDTLEILIEESLSKEQGSWLDLFRGNYLRRTWIATTLFILEQTNGNQFVQSYAPTFYVQQGLGAMSFTYAMIGQAIGVVGCGMGIVLFDITGRRPLMIYASLVCAFLLYLGSGLGTVADPNTNETNTLIACFILLPAFTRISASNNAFLTGSEIGGVRMRKKIMAFGTAMDVAAAFLVTFVTPYILPALGSNIGFIFGSVAAFSVVWAVFFFPELKGRSLEEIDDLFAAKLPAWRFNKYQTHGTARFLTDLENEKQVSVKQEMAREVEVEKEDAVR